MGFTSTAFTTSGSAFGVSDEPVAPVDPPVNTIPPLIRAQDTSSEFEIHYSGTIAQVITPGDWEGEPSLAYMWLHNGVETGSMNPSFFNPAAVSAVPGDTIQLRVTGVNAGGAVEAFSNTLNVIDTV